MKQNKARALTRNIANGGRSGNLEHPVPHGLLQWWIRYGRDRQPKPATENTGYAANELQKWGKQRGIKKLIYATLFIMIGFFSCKKEGFIPDKSRYDLREHNLVTPVRNQYGLMPDGSSNMGAPVGLCWAFAGLASMESNNQMLLEAANQGLLQD